MEWRDQWNSKISHCSSKISLSSSLPNVLLSACWIEDKCFLAFLSMLNTAGKGLEGADHSQCTFHIDNFRWWVCSGNWDVKTKIPEQCETSGIDLPPYFNEWINLKDIYLNFYKQRVCLLPPAFFLHNHSSCSSTVCTWKHANSVYSWELFMLCNRCFMEVQLTLLSIMLSITKRKSQCLITLAILTF